MKIIKKATTILDLFLNHECELSLEEMSIFSKMNKPTVRRIALTLVETGFLKQTTKRGKYSLGMKFLDFSVAIKKNTALSYLASPYLSKLSQSVNETAILVLWDGIRASLCESFYSDQPLQVIPDREVVTGIHYTSVGKAIIAEFPEEELERYFQNGLEGFTPNTITNLDDLKYNLSIIRREGVAFDDEEYCLGIRGIGAAIKNGEGNLVGAIGIVGPSVRLTRARLRELATIIKKCAIDISEELGYRNTDDITVVGATPIQISK